jgi:nitrosocyanin
VILLNHMNKTYTIIIVVVLVILGAWFVMSANQNAEAPATSNSVDQNSPFYPTGTSSGSESINPDATNPNAPVPAPTPTPTPKPVTNAVKSFTVTGQNFSFTPSTLSVKKGDTVKITFKDVMGGHNLKIDEFGAATNVLKVGEQQTITFVADKTGSFQYYCSVGSHRAMGMWGTLKVE